MPILSLKNVLLCRLKQALLDTYAEKSASFTNFLYEAKLPSYLAPDTGFNRTICWQKISLQKKRKITSLTYTSALPQIFASHQDCTSPLTVEEISEQMVSQLKQSQLQTLNSDLDHQKYELILYSKLWAEFEIKTHRPGWIELSLSDKGVEIWLQLIQLFFQQNSLCPPCPLKQEFLIFANYRASQAVKTLDQDHITLKVETLGQNHPKKPLRNQVKHNSINISQLANHTLTGRRLEVPINDTYTQPSSPDDMNVPSWESSSGRHVPIDTSTLRSTASPHQPAAALLWQVQYTHARCCSLLRLWQTACPQPQPIAPQDGPPQDRQTCIQSSDAQRLIHALIEIADDMFWIPYRWPSQHFFLLLKASNQLCQSFEAFYRACLSGFGQVSQAADIASELHYFHTQFGLVSTTKNMLKTLLQEYLEADLPTEL